MFGDPETFFQKIAQNCDLREGINGIYRIIFEMYRRQEEKVSNKNLARIVKIPVPVLSAVRSELVKAEFLKTKSLFSSQAIEWIQSKLNLKYTQKFFAEFISTSTLSLTQNYLDYFDPVIKYLDTRPSPEYKYDQSRSTSDTVIKRALLMLKNGDVEGKRIVILGDDDGVSIALAFLHCAKEIFVIDIDSRILSFIDTFSTQNNLTSILHSQLWDIRTTLPKEWLQKYDTFETDPPYTVTGFKLFLNQATNLLSLKPGGKGYISFGAKTPLETWACQQHLITSGYAIDEFLQNYNRYHGATLIGNASNMYVISSVQQKRRIFETNQSESSIYTFDEAKIKNLPAVGYQIIAEFYGVMQEFLEDGQKLKTIIEEGIIESKLKQEEIFTKEYTPYGLSLIAILVESHCHIHTWPEHDYISLDIFVCEEAEKAEHLFSYLLQKINPIDYHKFQFFRGSPPSKS
jgi:S-adenosylmethionine decarboxylase proenzyme